jgi:hypothetical protein
VTDLVGQLVLGQRLLDPAQHQAQSLDQFDGLEQLDLALDGQVRPPADDVGQGGGIVDPTQHLGQAAAAEALEERPERGPQLGRQVGDLAGDLAVGERGDVHPQGAGLADDAHAHLGAGGGADHQGRHPTGQVAAVLDAGDGADPGVAAVGLAGDEQQRVVGTGRGIGGGTGLVGLEGQRDDHVGEHHVVCQGEDRESQRVEISHVGGS